MQRLLVAAAILAALVGGFFLARALTEPEIISLPPLPPKTIRVEEVREIPVEGPERVVERVLWRTREVPVQVPVKVTEAGEVLEVLPGDARVVVEADQFVGSECGERARGWAGWARCEVRFQGEWISLVDEPFDIELSEAEGLNDTEIDLLVSPPQAQHRITLLGGVSGGGLAYGVGYQHHLNWRTRFGRAVLPDWIGGELLVLPETTAALVSVSWTF